MHLENATVRASAVSTLAKFGAMVDSLKVLLCCFPTFTTAVESCVNLFLMIEEKLTEFSIAASHICSAKALSL